MHFTLLLLQAGLRAAQLLVQVVQPRLLHLALLQCLGVLMLQALQLLVHMAHLILMLALLLQGRSSQGREQRGLPSWPLLLGQGR